MNRKAHSTLRAERLGRRGQWLVVALALIGFVSTADAQVTFQLEQTVDRTTVSMDGGVIEFRIDYSCMSALEGAEQPEMTCVFSSELDVVSITGSVHTVSGVPSATGKKVFFTFVDPLPAGATGQLRIQASFKEGVKEGDVVSMLATMDGKNAVRTESNEIPVTAVTTTAWQPSTYVPGLSLSTWAGSPTIALPSERGTFYVAHGNTGVEDISNYMVTSVLPDGTELVSLGTGSFAGSTLPTEILYRTNLEPTLKSWVISENGGSQYLYPDGLGLGAGEYVTGVQLRYGNLPGGGAFHPDRPGNEPIAIQLRAAPDHGFIAGETIEFVAAVEGDGVGEKAVATMVIGTSQPNFIFGDADNTMAAPYSTGDVVRMVVYIGSSTNNGVAIKDPNFAWLMPAEMDYLGNESFGGPGWVNMGSALPDIEKVPNFAGTGRTLIRFDWDLHEIQPNGVFDTLYSYFDVQLNASAVNGTTVTSEVYGGWQDPQGVGYSWMVPDDLDYDNDGDSTELIAKDTQEFSVDVNPGSGVAALDAVLWVKGSLDMNWNRYPDLGATVPGGNVDYELRLSNTGGVALKEIVIVDIFPFEGDTGVLQFNEARQSQWAPILAAAVSAPSGVDVLYSTSTNPLRAELVESEPDDAEVAAWTTVAPSDITTVKSIRFEFGENWLAAGEEIALSWPMRAPADALTDGSQAWNSFGYIATRADDGVQLLPEEPLKVGIAVQPDGGAYYGDWVWNDANHNGLIDPDEVGVSGVRVELYRDNGDYIPDPATDEFVTFTVTSTDGEADGNYLFANLPPGGYFTVVYLLEGFAASLPPDTTTTVAPAPTNGGGKKETASDPANLLAYTSDLGTFDSGTGDWWGEGNLSIKNTGGVVDGGNHMELTFRETPQLGTNGANLDVTQLFELGKIYKVSLYVKLKDVREEVRIQLASNVDDLLDEFTAMVDPGFADTDQWTKVSGTLTANWPGSSWGRSLRVNTSTTTQDFKMDQVVFEEHDSSKDSDGIRAYVSGMPVALLPVTDLSTGEQQLNWDQGIHLLGQGQPSVWAVASQGDGRLLIGGEFTAAHGVPRRNIARLLENGQVDTSFDPGSGTDQPVSAFAVLGSGHVVAGGGFTKYDGISVNGLACIGPDGSYVAGLAQPDKPDVRWMAVDSNGRLLVAGGFSAIGGEQRRSIARLNPDGSIDASFGPVIIDGPINGGALLEEGRIAIVGEFTGCAGEKMGGVAVLSESGELETEFRPSHGADGPIYTVSSKADRKLLLAGDFKSFNGKGVNGTVRIDRKGEVDVKLGSSRLDISTVRKSH